MLWKGEYSKDLFTDQTELIEEIGWEILDAKQGCIYHDLFPMLTMLLTLIRENK